MDRPTENEGSHASILGERSPDVEEFEREFARLQRENAELRVALARAESQAPAHIEPQLERATESEQAIQTLKVVLELSAVAMIVATASDGMVRWVNRAAVELLDCADEPSPCGQPVRELFQHGSWRTYRADSTPIPIEQRVMARVLRGENVVADEQRILRRDGTCRDILVSGAPVYCRSGELLAGVVAIRDVTDEKTKTEQLRLLGSEQRTILQTIRAGIVLVKQRRIEWTNASFLAMFRYGSNELRGVDTACMYASDADYERVGREGYGALARGSFYVTEALMRRKDGDEFWCSISGNALDPEHLDAGTIWVLQDVSERRAREAALRSSERKLTEIFKSSPEMLIVSSAEDGRFIEVNDAFSRLTGFSREEVINRTSLEIGLWPRPELRAELMRMVTQRGGVRNYEGQLCKKTGELIDVLFSCASFAISGVACLIWTIPDITEYKRIQRVARESEARFKRLVENSNDLIVVIAVGGEVSFVAGPVAEMTGYDFDDISGKRMLEFIHSDDVLEFQNGLRDVLAAPGANRRLESRLINKCGEVVDIESVLSNWIADPMINGIVCNIRDITVRKHADLERARLQTQLQQVTKMEAVGRLAGGVAHDFNNLLTVISGNLELAREDLDDADPVTQPLGEIRRAADSAAALTKQLLAFSRQQIVEPRIVNINELVMNLRNMLGRLIGEDIELRVNLVQDLGAVRVDPGQFEQVIINLVVNARDAMPLGGVIELETKNTELDEEHCRWRSDMKRGPYVMLAVTDSGHGMSEDTIRHIFEPFFTTKPKGHGTGLGLPTILGAVQQAGGTVDVYSEEGKGATFKLYLPRVDEPVEHVPRGGLQPPLPRGTETVLLVEDEPSVRALAATMLRRLGYALVVASNGEEALRLAADHKRPIALLMTDVVMPGKGGRELAEELSASHPETVVLFTSGYTEDVIIHRGVLSENVSFIGKPYSMQTLAFKLRQVIESGCRAASGRVPDQNNE